jgi:hypothetical protein
MLHFIPNIDNFFVANSEGYITRRKQFTKPSSYASYREWLDGPIQRRPEYLPSTSDLELLKKAIFESGEDIPLVIPSKIAQDEYEKLRSTGHNETETLLKLWDRKWRSTNGKTVILKHPYIK